MSRVLIVDDEEAFAQGIVEYLELQGYSPTAAHSLAEAEAAVKSSPPDVVFLDLMLPDGSGLQMFDSFKENPPKKIVIMTGHSGVKSLVAGMSGENVSFLKKPIEPRDLAAILNAVEGVETKAGSHGDHPGHFGLMIGESDAMHAVYSKIRQVAPTNSTVFIQGESGTGKELVAEAIHRTSKRSGRFIPVNCGGLSRDLAGSHLFGHERGSFTGADKRHVGFFERADQGTLFLDEITEMPLDLQAHLLRVLETSSVLRLGAEKEIRLDTRLVAATNRDPGDAVKDSKLREDLFFRLSVFPIVLPPLRERLGDIPLLARHYLDQLNEQNNTSKWLSEEALEDLERHTWPGNVRELKHTIQRAYIMSDSDLVTIPEHLDLRAMNQIEGLAIGRSIADVEKDLILSTLRHYKGDKAAAAATLGVSLKTIYNRLKSYEEEGEAYMADG